MPTAPPRTQAAALNLVHRFRARELGRAPVRPLLAAADAIQPTSTQPVAPSPRLQNPFLNQRHPVTGKWQEPRYSRRRQAELVKAARLSGTLHLLPPGPKLRPSEIADFKAALDKRLLEEAKAAGTAIPLPRGKGRRRKPRYKLPDDGVQWFHRKVVWTGRLWDKPAKGHDVGARLYARKRFMFKGHRWEKVIKLRKKFISLRLRSQKRRIDKWHATRIIKRNPFNPVRHTARLPF
ncbi:hypothetical protein EXIGLDRAFT_845643 [Exidia glandulosa HHB12029]|uniref:Large ribosomal subunit protein mL59 domain-containing protein n=1 Tax=Exidia glandulosa HHB12029 TaxID=1314781 RepID=A0A165BCW5_EXIGL|nr:hypothetical protein EXIGLDRAFT_845643 [Exidia glandulosa HHB12029]